MSEPIVAVEQITPAWLTRVLRANGHLERGKVVAVQPVGQESGCSPSAISWFR
jgi:hypothetical protein